jgi:hypothetical protein
LARAACRLAATERTDEETQMKQAPPGFTQPQRPSKQALDRHSRGREHGDASGLRGWQIVPSQ